MSGRLHSIEYGTSAQTVAKMLNVLFPDARTVLDMTYGSGKFWTDNPPWRVTGIDLNPERARDVCADFTRLPFADGTFDVTIFDPPYLAQCSKQGTSKMDGLFSSYPSRHAAQEAITGGATEAWRVGQLGAIVKVQNYSNSEGSWRLTTWVESVIPEVPYGEVHQVTIAKMAPWKRQLSVWSIHTTFLAFRHGSQRHVRRSQSLADAVTVTPSQQIALWDAGEGVAG